MGNTTTKPSRSRAGSTNTHPEHSHHYSNDGPGPHDGTGNGSSSQITYVPGLRQAQAVSAARNASRFRRTDSDSANTDGSSNVEGARKETKAERDARKLAKDQVNRYKERLRSMPAEHVDGGYLVTMGMYTGIEDFDKSVVRKLIIERKIAPFWRGLDDHSETWSDEQMLEAIRSPLPANITTEKTLSEEEKAKIKQQIDAGRSKTTATQIPIHKITERSATSPLSSSHPHQASSPTGLSSLRSRAKTLASTSISNVPNVLSGSSNSGSKEVLLHEDPDSEASLNAQIYRNATECPICFLTYPAYLNQTRCCDQPICSECFVQIKRAEPHVPEHHDGPPAAGAPPPEPPRADDLVSEPAQCPYCAQPEFGITYEPPHFRRGLMYESALSKSLSKTDLGGSPSSSPGSAAAMMTRHRRASSLAVGDSNVISSDRIRPDWQVKLLDARLQISRRAAAASALHAAAYMFNDRTSASRFMGLGGSRGIRRASDGRTQTTSMTHRDSMAALVGRLDQLANSEGDAAAGADAIPPRGSSRRPNRLEDLEEMLLFEAIRQSIAAEEERQRKAEKAAEKEAKKRAKEEKKQEKKNAKNAKNLGTLYGLASPSSSSSMSRNAGGSTLSFLSNPLSSNRKGKASVQPDDDNADDENDSDSTHEALQSSETLNSPGSSRFLQSTSSLPSSAFADGHLNSLKDLPIRTPRPGGSSSGSSLHSLRPQDHNEANGSKSGPHDLIEFASLDAVVDSGSSSPPLTTVNTEIPHTDESQTKAAISDAMSTPLGRNDSSRNLNQHGIEAHDTAAPHGERPRDDTAKEAVQLISNTNYHNYEHA